MHRALIVPSKYNPSSGYLDREGWRHSSRALGARLKEHGYAVETLEPGPGLVQNLRRALATEDPLSAVVIVFCGYLLLTETQEPALLLSDEQVIALRLEQLCNKAARTFGRVLLVIDGVRGSSTRLVQDANAGAPDASAEELLSQMAASVVRADNTGLLLSLAPWGAPDAVPDHGLCQRLTDILGELDDTQAMSTPELEFTLNSSNHDGSRITCRHSKPAFVFLPARRFQPPSGGTPPYARQHVVDSSVDPDENRADDGDRSAWTPPPDTPTPIPYRESRPSIRPSAGAVPPASGGGLPPAQATTSRVSAPGLDAPPPQPVEGRPSQPNSARPLGVPPPLPSERAVVLQPPPLPPLPAIPSFPTSVTVPPPLPGVASHLPAVPPPAAASFRPQVVPPPLPVVVPTVAAPPLPHVDEPLPHVDEPLPHVDEPLPHVDEPSPHVAEPLPHVAEPLPDFAPLAQARTALDPVPPPLPAGLPPVPDVPSDEPNAMDAPPHAEASAAVAAPPTSEAVSTPPARSGPPPRRRRNSADADAAPSLPPLAISPESWRPQGLPQGAPRDEAALLALAQTALVQGQNDVALEHASRCLDSFPESASALQIVATLLVGAGQFEQLAYVYERLIAALAPTHAAQLCAAAARLWHAQLGNIAKARELLERGLELDVNNASLQREVADLLDEVGDSAAALEHAFRSVQLNPMSPQAANAAFQRLEQTSEKERTFNVACVLSFLGQANNRVADTVAACRTPTLPKPTRALFDDDFRLGLDVTPQDPELTRLFVQLEPFVRLLELPKPKVQRQLLDSLRAEDVERSTTMLARTFGWTCRLLTLGTPGLFLAETDALPSRLPVEQVGFVVGKSLGRGLSLAELVFIWARSLSMARTQTRILHSLSSPSKLVEFLQACRSVLDIEQAGSSDVKQLAKAIKKLIPQQTLATLASSLGGLGPNYDARVERWKLEADRVANCIGLVACGDPELAARTLDRFPLSESSPKRQQLADLLSFALSDNYEQLRSRLGLHLG